MKRLKGFLSRIPDLFDAILLWIGRITILGIRLILAYAVVSLLIGREAPADSRVGQVLKLANDNWIAVLLVIFPLFYPPIRSLLDRATSLTAGPFTVAAAAKEKNP